MSSRLWTNINKFNPNLEQWMHCLKCVDETQRNKFLPFVFQKNVKSSLIGQLLIRYYLCRVLHCSNSEVSISLTQNKRPHVAGQCVDFNISHDGDLVVLVGDLNASIGVDVVHINRHLGSGSITKFLDIMKRQLTSGEWRWVVGMNSSHENILSSSPATDEQRLFSFYRCWCMKESYVKAIGIGIGFSFSRLECVFNTHLLGNTCNQLNTCIQLNESPVMSSQIKSDGLLEEEWRFEESYLMNEYIVCTAIKSKILVDDKDNEMVEILPDDILDSLSPLKDNYTDEEIDYFSQQWINFQSKTLKAGD